MLMCLKHIYSTLTEEKENGDRMNPIALQLYADSIILGSLAGFIIFTLGGVMKFSQTDEMFTKGVHMMAMIGFIMIAASGFAEVMKSTGGIDTLISSAVALVGDPKALAALLMLVVGLLVTMGIGSSFSTIPILAPIYVPLAVAFGFPLWRSLRWWVLQGHWVMPVLRLLTLHSVPHRGSMRMASMTTSGIRSYRHSYILIYRSYSLAGLRQ